MTDSANSQNFYLGRVFDPTSAKTSDQRLDFDPADLTTHGVIIGMTGSGKTGLGIDILEEAALQGIPAIIIDPKGDLGNLLLHFPELQPQDFQPWLDPDTARRAGKSLADLAADTAVNWKNGLAGWGLGRENLLKLQSAVKFAVYTPGSSAGQSISILSSFSAPGIAWAENVEVLREKISANVTALLGLIGLKDIDPLRSREHILVSNIIETAWSGGKSLELTDLIMQIQKPPFERLGAFPVENFFPQKDRFELAVSLNNILAAPSFQTWLEGQGLDIGSMMYTPEGRPCHNIFYIAHLNDDERMFFVTLLLAAVEAWMRTQRGTSSLRALLYFDEISGYLPPVMNPPSRPILLRMLKQARAFGVGMLLATQNPVDLDYKALSNAGTWMVGRLQTDQDKQRLLDGLQSSSGALDRSAYDHLIAGLQKRVFLLHSVHRDQPDLFSTRWTLNFLAGPIMRAQIPQLNAMTSIGSMPGTAVASAPAPAAAVIPPKTAYSQMPAAGAGAVPSAGASDPALAATIPVTIDRSSPLVKQAPPVSSPTHVGYLSTRPALAAGVSEYFLPAEIGMREAAAAAGLGGNQPLTAEGLAYHPALFAQAETHYVARKYNLDYSQRRAILVNSTQVGRVRWEDYAAQPVDARRLASDPLPQTQFAAIPGWLSDARRLKTMQDDFVDWVYRSGTLRMRANETLKVYAGPDTSSAQFREMCSDAARKAAEAENKKLEDLYGRKLDVLEKKIDRQKMEVRAQGDELSQRRMEETGAIVDFGLGLFSRRKRSLTTSLSKHRLASQAKDDRDQEQKQLDQLEAELDALEKELQDQQKAVQDKWAQTVNDASEVPLVPLKKDIYVELFGVAWLPYYQVSIGSGPVQEIPAFPPAPK